MWIPYRASSNFTWFQAWFRLVPLVSTFAESYKLPHFGLVPGWFHLVPHSPNHTNYNTLAWFPVGSTFAESCKLQHLGLVPGWFHFVPRSPNHTLQHTGLVPGWFHLAPHSRNHANYNTWAWFQVGSTGFRTPQIIRITTHWFGSRLVPLGSTFAESCKLEHFGLVPGWFHLVPRSTKHTNYNTKASCRSVPHSQKHANYNTLACSWAWFRLVPLGSTLPESYKLQRDGSDPDF